MESELETASKLSNGTSFNNLEWTITQISGHDIIQRQITQKRLSNGAILNDLEYTRFQGHAILWCWISQKRYEIPT